MSLLTIWDYCKSHLENDLAKQQFITWIQPLELDQDQTDYLCLISPNRFVKSHVELHFLSIIESLVENFSSSHIPKVSIVDASSHQRRHTDVQAITSVDSSAVCQSQESVLNETRSANPPSKDAVSSIMPLNDVATVKAESQNDDFLNNIMLNASVSDQGNDSSQENSDSHLDSYNSANHFVSHVDSGLNFTSFVEGKSNQLARAAAMQVAENPGGSYNPLFLYGASGLGKTHLMHAVGNALIQRKPQAKVAYLHSERFVANMVKAIQQNKINEFKRYYRSVDALLIDDIQFFAGKDRSQEEFFHTFNALIEGGQQIILTCDRYPREVEGLEERLKTRFGWGLSVAVEPPELETRVAILMQKARQQNMHMSEESAFFIARRLRSNVRELEGALKRVIAQAHFKARPIDIELIKESLKDLLSMQDRLVSIDNIQRTVAEYYKIKVADLHSKRRNRSVARPRQVAMSLAKELTSHSLPEIGDAFGGRDHTTVLHACRKIDELKESSTDIAEDLKNLLRTLTA